MFLHRRSHPPTLFPCDHLVTAFCVWEWGSPKLRWAFHGDNQATQNIYRDSKYFLHFMCHQHEQLAKTLLEHVHGGTLTLDQAGRKGINLSKLVKWMPHHTNHQKPCQAETPTKHLTSRFGEISKGGHSCSPYLRTVLTSSGLRWKTQADDYWTKAKQMLEVLVPWICWQTFTGAWMRGKTKQDPDTQKLSKLTCGYFMMCSNWILNCFHQNDTSWWLCCMSHLTANAELDWFCPTTASNIPLNPWGFPSHHKQSKRKHRYKPTQRMIQSDEHWRHQTVH